MLKKCVYISEKKNHAKALEIAERCLKCLNYERQICEN